tara:strand:+ start:442 stop:714 length:273 start_codon:yes stop_codon:yes gene_type:complete
MPTYDYICDECKKRFEYFQSMSADPLTDCPECKKNSLRRIISGGTGLIFKGSGYYLTDYKDKKTDKFEKKDNTIKKVKKSSKQKKEVGSE